MTILKLKCPKHPRYSAANDGPGAIKGGCAYCTAIYALWQQAVKLIRGGAAE